MPKKKIDNSTLLRNVSRVVLNKAALIDEQPCARVLGGPSNVQRAALVGLQNSDILGLITAHLVVNYCLNENKSTEETQQFKAGVTGFITFLADCAQETEKTKAKAALEKRKKEDKNTVDGP